MYLDASRAVGAEAKNPSAYNPSGCYGMQAAQSALRQSKLLAQAYKAAKDASHAVGAEAKVHGSKTFSCYGDAS